MSISILSLLKSVILARALFVAADLNIAEHVSSQPMTVNEIAAVTNSNPASLQRLLYFLELCEVFEKHDDEKYYLNEFSQTMRSNDPRTIKPFLLHDDETRWNSFGHLGCSIATGNASFDMLYGTDYFSYLKENPLLSTRFNDAMVIISAQENAIIAQTISFKGIVADIGGGTGQLLNNIAETNPINAGILFDLPEAVEQATDLHPICSKQGGSFFEPIPCSADIFILKRIMHDWDDAQALQILTNVCNAMDENSRLYIIDGILDYSENKSELAAIDLALLTIFQGRERTKAEFETLIQAAGLKIISIQTITEIICAIECKKRSS